jgi:hypothetical protein
MGGGGREHGVLTVLEQLEQGGKGGEGVWGGEEQAPGPGAGKGGGTRRTLVISGMGREAVERYGRLRYSEVPGTKGG